MAIRGLNRGLMIVGAAALAWGVVCDAACGQPVTLPPAPQGVSSVRAVGFEFAIVDHAGNAGIPWNTVGVEALPFTLPVQLQGRGSVAHNFAISRTEVGTRQWLGFVNTFSGRADYPEQLRSILGYELRNGPFFWGAQRDPSYTGPGFRYRLNPSNPQAGDLPVGGISWRLSALYCNWLHNGRSSDWSALMDGAYDVSTFGRSTVGPNTYSDAPTHRPGARFWIPTIDEWFKATFFDPDRFGPDQPGWWTYVHGSDEPPVLGPPGVGESSAGLYDPVEGPIYWQLPLASYPDQQSPWGLLDTGDAAAEWAEDWFYPNHPSSRYLMGAWTGDAPLDDLTAFRVYLSRFTGLSSLAPTSNGLVEGLRIASSIPPPETGVISLLLAPLVSLRRKRRVLCAHTS